MSLRAAAIRDGIVVNAILIENESFSLPDHIIVISDIAKIGDLYDGDFFRDPITNEVRV